MRLLILLLVTNLFLYAYDAINGQVSLLTFDASKSVSLLENGKKVPLLVDPSDAKKYFALIAVPYRQNKDIELDYKTTKGVEHLFLHVKEGAYKKEQISVAPSKVSPSKTALAEIKKEAKEADKIYSTFTPKRYWDKPFKEPLQSSVTSPFGTARMFNGTLHSYHTGTDMRAAFGTPVHASNDGIVVLTKARYYAGGSVIIDHGEGIYSVYFHLSKIDVHVGEKVKRSELIGLSGASGRVNGPHLHFGFMIQNIPIDPLDFITKINTLFK